MSGKVQTELELLHVYSAKTFWFDLAVVTKLNPVSLQSTVAACKLCAPGPCQVPNHAWALLRRVLAGLHKNYTRDHSNNI